jgi:hypothetical protein
MFSQVLFRFEGGNDSLHQGSRLKEWPAATGYIIARNLTSSTGNRAAHDVAGLSYDTKFDVKRAIGLPYASEWFAVPPAAPHGQTPKLGTLHPSLVLALRRLIMQLKCDSERDH